MYNKFQYNDGKIEETNPLFGNHKVIEDLLSPVVAQELRDMVLKGYFKP